MQEQSTSATDGLFQAMVILIIAIVIFFIFWTIGNSFAEKRCEAYATMEGLTFKYIYTDGCYLKTEKGYVELDLYKLRK